MLMHRDARRGLLRVLASGAVLHPQWARAAQSWPTTQQTAWPIKGLTLVVPYAPGVGPDVLTRLLAAQLYRQLGRPVVTDYRGAAGGSMSAWIAAQASADGYTYFMGAMHDLIAAARYRKLDFDLQADLTPVVAMADIPLALLINTRRVRARSLGALLKDLRTRRGTLSCGSAGVGTVQHLAAEDFMAATQTQARLTQVPYPSATLALADLVAGKIDLVFDALSNAVPYLQGGVLQGDEPSEGLVQALMVAAPERAPAFADVPTATELGLRDYEAFITTGLWAVRDTPQDIIERMGNEVARALKVPEVALAWAHFGAQINVMKAADFAQQTRRDAERWLQANKANTKRK